jgi:multicomponent Na+:H+ antiporter subunit E
VNRSSLGRRLLHLVWLVVVWSLLVGSVRPDVVLGGALVGALVLAGSRLPALPRHSRIRWHRLPGLGARLLRDLAMSTVQVTVATLSRGPATRSSIIAVDVPPDASDAALTAACQRISLEPGSLVLDLDRERNRVFVYQIDTREPRDVEHARQRTHAVIADVMATFPPLPRSGAAATGDPENGGRG